MAKSILITGGSGFIAPYLIDALDAGRPVILHVRNPVKQQVVVPRPGLRVIAGELTAERLLDEVAGDCEAVIHLAGAVHGPDTSAIMDSNVVSTSNVLSFMRARKIPRLVFMSTAAVWDGTDDVRLTEDVEPNPSTLYGCAKLAAERLIDSALRSGALSTAAVLRCNNTYGDGSIQGAVAAFRTRLQNNQPVQIDGDGRQLREPLYVSDLVDVLIRALERPAGLHTYAISGPQTLTVLQMAEIMARSAGVELSVDWKPARSDRSRHLIFDTSKARREMGWRPALGFEEGVRLLLRGAGIKAL